MKKLCTVSLIIFLLSLSITSKADQYDDLNSQATSIARDLKENGPANIRRLDFATIRSQALSLLIGQSMGTISSAEMARMGGVKEALQSSLQGQLKAAGQ